MTKQTLTSNSEHRPSAKVAIVHDWLVAGGAERVVEQLHQMYPEAPIYTSYCSDMWRRRLDGTVVTGWLQHWPFSRLRKFIPLLRIWWFTHLDLADYDLVISSSGAEAKGVRVKPGTLHINYCHAPTHYYWMRYDEYLRNPGFGKFDSLARLGLKLLVGPLRRWDYRAAQRPDVMLANSSHTQAMIKHYYKRDSEVVFPPIDVARFKRPTGMIERRGYVITGRQTPYKRVDIAVEACTLLNLPLTVIGNGPDHVRLQKLAGPTVTFLTKVTDEEMASHFHSALAFLFPGNDDFGIAPLEALAAGTAVIAYKAGGALDYVIPGKTGVFFEPQTTQALVDAIRHFNAERYDATMLAAKAAEFSPAVFRQHMRSVIATSKQ